MADGACLILMDLDHFKTVNDRFGHLEGDLVLKESVRLIGSMLGPNDIFARFGGEEFVVLIPGCNLDEATALAGRLRGVLEANTFVLARISPSRRASVLRRAISGRWDGGGWSRPPMQRSIAPSPTAATVYATHARCIRHLCRIFLTITATA
jgi:GGDEF domain-containing protein